MFINSAADVYQVPMAASHHQLLLNTSEAAKMFHTLLQLLITRFNCWWSVHVQLLMAIYSYTVAIAACALTAQCKAFS